MYMILHVTFRFDSLKCFAAGYIILRGWCENPNTLANSRKFSVNQKESWSAPKVKLKPHGNHARKPSKRDNNKTVLWFEVDDTGCGIHPKL